MEAIRSLNIGVKAGNSVQIPKDEIWKVTVLTPNGSGQAISSIESANSQIIVGGGIRISNGERNDRLITGLAFKL